MFQDQLLDEIKCLLVLHMLSHLDNCAPSVRSEFFLTVVTLHVKLGEFSNEGLFNFCVVVKLLFDSDFNFDSFRMALSPYETSINDFGFVETFDFFQQQC